jgi:hypothetical protein
VECKKERKSERDGADVQLEPRDGQEKGVVARQADQVAGVDREAEEEQALGGFRAQNGGAGIGLRERACILVRSGCSTTCGGAAVWDRARTSLLSHCTIMYWHGHALGTDDTKRPG